MLREHNIPSLQSRRKDQRLTYMYRVVEGLVPAVPAQEYLTPRKPGRQVKAKKLEKFDSDNFVQKLATQNASCFTVPKCKTDQCRN